MSGKCKACAVGLLVAIAWSSVGCGSRLPQDVPPDLVVAKNLRGELAAAAGGTGEATESAAQADPTGWATMTGTFKLIGTAPAATALTVDKDREVCAPGGMTVYANDLVVGANQGIGNVLIFCSQKLPSDEEPWTHPSAKPGLATEALFDQKQCVFLTHVFAAQSSQPIKIMNSDPVGHNASFSPKKNPSFNGLVASNGGFTVYQPKAEEDQPFQVTCSIHPWMKAWMITRNNSYFAVTKDDGSFEIANLPAGVPLEFRVWQERGKFSTVTVNGSAEKWARGKFKKTLEAGQTLTMNVEVDAATFQ